MKIVDVTPGTTLEHGFFCIKDRRAPGFRSKESWFQKHFSETMRIKIACSADGQQIGFIEYVNAEQAWRPVQAPGWTFIHCLMVYPLKNRDSGAATGLIEAVIREARTAEKQGVCVMTSKGPWMATDKVFLKNGFRQVERKGRFELMAYPLSPAAPTPGLIDWESNLKGLAGWHLYYADQCPWHEKGVRAIEKAAAEMGIRLQMHKITHAEEAQRSPSGFGTFALVRDGKLMEDHYISERRFRTIVDAAKAE